MKTRLQPGLAVVLLAFVARPGQAQEVGQSPPAVPPILAAPCPEPGPPPCEKTRTEYRIHWLPREVPVEKLTLREAVTKEPRTNLELGWQEEKVVRTELKLKPREVVKEVTRCTVQPVTETDPCTGCPTVVFKPVTEVKLVKEVVFDAVPEEKVYTIRRPCLKPVEKVYSVKHWELECTPGTRRERFGILIPTEVTERVLTPPPCPPQPIAWPAVP
jgi:hypothetical protein